jgi:hypothetical protein
MMPAPEAAHFASDILVIAIVIFALVSAEEVQLSSLFPTL